MSYINARNGQYNLILPFVHEATQQFVKAQAMREAISLALVSGKFFIFYGPGGHGKSEFVKAVFDCIGDASTYVLSFGSDMSEDSLYGGIDLKAINDQEDPRIAYDVENSFLAYDLAIFEEGFDAPGPVVRSLKDTLTAKKLRKGRQQRVMETRTIGLLTNHQPKDIAEKGPDYQALIERYPIQLTVSWGSYKPVDFINMFNATAAEYYCASFSKAEWIELQELSRLVEIPKEVQQVLAELIGEVHANSGFISPRSAMHALDLLRASSVINGRTTAQVEDIIACKYLPGMEGIAQQMESKVKEAHERAVAETLLNDGWRVFDAIRSRVTGNSSIILRLQYAAWLQQLLDEVNNQIQPPTQLQPQKEELINTINELFGKLGGFTDLYEDVKVVLPEQMIGVNFYVGKPESSELTLWQQRELPPEVVEDDEEDHENDVYDDEEEDDETTMGSAFKKAGVSGTSRFSGASSLPTSSVSRFGKKEEK